MMSNSVIRVPAKILNDIKDELNNGRKISAIKLCRSNGKINGGGSIGLKEAKLAIERFEDSLGLKSYPNHAQQAAHLIQAETFIRSITLDLGGGELTVDLEQMEMRALMGLDSMGIEEVARVLDLVKVLKAFSEGANISIDRVMEEEGEQDATE
tara:strand:- start:1423 stop:1884 length:462 start_codon:yes stop_codon:yes gene_type:complete